MRVVPLLIIACNALSSEVQLLEEDPSADAVNMRGISDGTESANQMVARDASQEREVKHSLATALRKQLVKEVDKSYQETFGEKLIKPSKHDWMNQESMAFSKREVSAFHFVHKMTDEWEQMTGKKITDLVDKDALDDDTLSPHPSSPAKMKELVHSMEKDEKLMKGTKGDLNMPKAEDMPVEISKPGEVDKQLEMMEEERKHAWKALPKPTGGEKKEIPNDGKRIASRANQKRDIALAADAERKKVEDKRNEHKAARDMDAAKTKDRREESRQERAEQADPEKSGGELKPSALDDLLEVGEGSEQEPVANATETDSSSGAKVANATQADATKKTPAGDDSAAAKEQKAEDLAKAAGVQLPNKVKGLSTDKPGAEWHDKSHSRLDKVEQAVAGAMKDAKKTEKMREDDEDPAFKEAKEKRKAKDAAFAAAKNATDAKANAAADAAAEAYAKATKAGKAIACPKPNDLECMRKRSKEMDHKAKVDRHTAYDAQREAAKSVANGADINQTDIFDHKAEQLAVVAAVIQGEADRAREDLDRLKAKNAAQEKAEKAKTRKATKVESEAVKLAGDQVQKEAKKLEAKKNAKVIEKAEEKAEAVAKGIKAKIKEKEGAEEKTKEDAKAKAEEETAAKEEATAKKEAKKEEETANKEIAKQEKEAVKKAEAEVEAADKKVADDEASADPKAVGVKDKVDADEAPSQEANDEAESAKEEADAEAPPKR